MSILRLVIPGPIVSGNASFRFRAAGKRVMRYTSPEAAEYKKRVNAIAFAEVLRNRWKAAEECTVEIIAFSSRCDVDNLAKCVLDGMQGAVYKNDRAIQKLVVEKRKDKGGQRLEITVEKAA